MAVAATPDGCTANCSRPHRSPQRLILQLHAREGRTKAALLTRDRALRGHLRHSLQLGLDALVPPPVMEEVLQGDAIITPGAERPLGDLGKLAVVVR